MAGRFSVDAVFRAIDKMTAPITKMQSRMERFTKATEKSFKQLDGAADRWLGGLKNAGIGAAAAAAGVGAALWAAAQPGMEFDQAMANLGATSLQTRDQLGALEKAAKKLGAETQFSSTDVVHAMEQMSKAGLDEQQILAAIPGMVYAASAAGEDLAETTAAVTHVMKGMGLEANQAQSLADAMALASVKTDSSMSSLAESMSKLAPTAKQFGIHVNDALAMAALLQDVGIDASEAGTAVATMLTKLSDPTDEARGKMKKFGISFQDAAGNMKSPVEVLKAFTQAAKGAGGNMAQAAFFAELVGMRGQRAAINLKDSLGKASGGFLELQEALSKSAGTAEKMAKIRMDTLGGDIDRLKEGFNTFLIDVYALESGPLRKVIQQMDAWLSKNQAAIVEGIGNAFKWIADNLDTILAWAGRIARFIAVITAVAVAIKLVTAAVWLLSATPLTIWLVAITAVLALIVAFWPDIVAFFASIWQGMVDIAGFIVEKVVGIFSALWGVLKPLLTGFFEFIVGMMVLIWKPILDPLFRIMATVGGFLYDRVIEPVFEAFRWLWDQVTAVASVAFDAVLAVGKVWYEGFTTIWGALTGFFSKLWSGISGVFERVLAPILDKITWAVDKVRALGRSVLGTDEESSEGTSAPTTGPQVVSPADRVARSISETTTTNQSELVIRDQTGKASFSKQSPGANMSLSLAQSGGF